MAEDSLPPGKPLVIYDGRCGFCKIWIQYSKTLTGDRMAYAPSQEVGTDYPQIPEKNFGESVQLVTAEGSVYSGAQAVYRTLSCAPGYSWLAWCYDRVPGFAASSEAAYRLIAEHRTFFYHVTRLTFGKRAASSCDNRELTAMSL